jgi:Protein of unknown function (DUF3175)
VTRDSNALDLEADVFTLEDPREFARSLKRSVRGHAHKIVGPAKIEASIANGILTVKAQKSAPSVTKKIEIKPAG